ncbi:MAG: hypothetical protein ACI89L_002151 [Phycisphaerales bacterium]|jgi:hypothetical protein
MLRPACPTCGQRDAVRVRHTPLNYLAIAISTVAFVLISWDILPVRWRCKTDSCEFRASGQTAD